MASSEDYVFLNHFRNELLHVFAGEAIAATSLSMHGGHASLKVACCTPWLTAGRDRHVYYGARPGVL